MLVNTPNGVVHRGRAEPSSTLVPSKREVAAALKDLTEMLEKEGLTNPEVAYYLDTLWTYVATR